MAATSVILVRHGETEWSRSGRHTGRTDIELCDEGRRQAAALRELLDQWSFGLVLTSPLGRARETARLSGLGDIAQIDDDLAEWDYGDLEGRTTDEIRQEMPGWTIWSGPVPGGESIDEVCTRADRVIERLLTTSGDVALFGHGHHLRILGARWIELAPVEGRGFELSTATVSTLGWERGTPVISSWNQRPA
jgi:probable phosphoglycerate mutase